MKSRLLTIAIASLTLAAFSVSAADSKPRQKSERKSAGKRVTSVQVSKATRPIQPVLLIVDRQAMDRTAAADLKYLLTRVPMVR